MELEVGKENLRPCKLLNALNGFIIANFIHVQITLECSFCKLKTCVATFRNSWRLEGDLLITV
jgi:hypothetical protein